jgi:hypothetical protein
MDMVIAQERQSARKEFKAADEEMQRAFEAKLAALEGRVKAVPGKLPVSKIWREESVTYEGEVVSFDGSLYQARKDTAQVPGGSDWICVARAGRDAVTPDVRGTYKPGENYKSLDIVALGGSSLIARKDDPGPCPGDGWQILASRGEVGDRGRPGPTGKRGERGEKGEAAPMIISWVLDRTHYRAVATLSNGKPGPVLDLRPLFEAFLVEAGHALASD